MTEPDLAQPATSSPVLVADQTAVTSTPTSVTRALVRAGAGLLLVVTVLLVLVAVLPDHEPFLAKTVSANAHGPYGRLVFALLLLFALASAALATALGLRLRGAAGPACAALVGMWSVAAGFDAFVPTASRAHTGTAFGQVHTMIAVAGVVAQLFAALGYLGVVRRRQGRVPALLLVVTAAVLAGVIFFALHPDSLAGLSERLLFAVSALWMLTSVRVVPSMRSRSPRPYSEP